MDRTLFTLSLGLAGLMASPLYAGPQCAPHDSVAAELAKQYGEAPHAMGLAQDNTVMELYAAESGTWTLTVTLANGQTCLVAAGNNFEAIVKALPAKGDPT